jgi:oligopeptide transport system permease protein
MLAYTLRRTLWAIPTILAVITACYLLLHLTPGGPFDTEKQLSAAVLANLQAKYHLDEPLWKQYLHYLGSPAARRPRARRSATPTGRSTTWCGKRCRCRLGVGGVSMPLAVVIGVALGIGAALRRNSAADSLRDAASAISAARFRRS